MRIIECYYLLYSIYYYLQSVCRKSQGYIDICRDVFNNPEHSLDGLDEFSHMWIIYHFHRNDSHARAKVAPPRM